MGVQKSAEAIVGWLPLTEGLNMRNRLEANPSMMERVVERSDEKQTLTHKPCEQNSQQLGVETTNITAGAEHLHEESTDLLSQVLDRSNMMLAYDRVCRNKGASGIVWYDSG